MASEAEIRVHLPGDGLRFGQIGPVEARGAEAGSAVDGRLRGLARLRLGNAGPGGPPRT